MINRLLVLTACAVCFFLASFSVSLAQDRQAWTPARIHSLTGKVVKFQVKFPVKFTTGKKFKMAGFFYFKVKHVNRCLHHTERKWVMRCLLRKNMGRKPVQTVIHGLTYDHRYWDSKRINGQSYSYARFMAQNGFIVLALDLLGSGKSDVPNGDLLNIEQSTFTIAQVLSRLKSGDNSIHRPFKTVILVGHSLGSALSVITLGTFPRSADALVVTGWAFAPHVVLPPDLLQAALMNPYVQLPPQIRIDLFYCLRKADPAVIRFDNRNLADQTPRGIFQQGLPLLQAMAMGNADDIKFIKEFSRSNRIKVPVLVQLGEFDVIAPSRLADQEADFYPNAPKVKVQTLSNIGHSFNLHENNKKSWRRVKEWLNRVVN